MILPYETKRSWQLGEEQVHRHLPYERTIVTTTKQAALFDCAHMVIALIRPSWRTRVRTGNHIASPYAGLMRSRTKTTFIFLLFGTKTESVDP